MSLLDLIPDIQNDVDKQEIVKFTNNIPDNSIYPSLMTSSNIFYGHNLNK